MTKPLVTSPTHPQRQPATSILKIACVFSKALRLERPPGAVSRNDGWDLTRLPTVAESPRQTLNSSSGPRAQTSIAWCRFRSSCQGLTASVDGCDRQVSQFATCAVEKCEPCMSYMLLSMHCETLRIDLLLLWRGDTAECKHFSQAAPL